MRRGALALGLAWGLVALGGPVWGSGEGVLDFETGGGSLEAPASAALGGFGSVGEAVAWRQEQFKALERLIKQLRFDLVINRDAVGAAPKLAKLQEMSRGAHFLPAFIEGSGGRGTEAKPRIWEEWQTFRTGFDDLESKVSLLIESAEAQAYDQATRRLSDVGLSCKGCHRPYRY